MMPDITKIIQPPRALAVPFRLGFPLGEPQNRELQRDVLTALLDLCREPETPVIQKFQAGNAYSTEEINASSLSQPFDRLQ